MSASPPGRCDLRPARRYALPEALRPELARPWGPVVSTGALREAVGDARIIAVGDVVATTVLDLGMEPKMIVVDYKTQRGDDPALRRRLGTFGDREIRVDNPPAVLTRQAWDAVADALAKPGTSRIVVDGEEDLLGIPCFLEAGHGMVVLYGIPGQGVAVVEVTQRVQAMVARLVEQMVEA